VQSNDGLIGTPVQDAEAPQILQAFKPQPQRTGGEAEDLGVADKLGERGALGGDGEAAAEFSATCVVPAGRGNHRQTGEGAFGSFRTKHECHQRPFPSRKLLGRQSDCLRWLRHCGPSAERPNL
jgi:hypothetical protein